MFPPTGHKGSFFSTSSSTLDICCLFYKSYSDRWAYSNSCPLTLGFHPTISSSVIPFCSCLQPFPASGSFPMSQFFTLGGQSIGVSASASVLPMNTQDWFPCRIDWFDLLAVQGTLKSLLQHHSSKPSILRCSAFFIVQLSHPYMTTGKTIALTVWIFVGKVMSQLFNMLSMLVIAFLPRSKSLVTVSNVLLRVILNMKSGNSDKLYFLGLQNRCGWWLQPQN